MMLRAAVVSAVACLCSLPTLVLAASPPDTVPLRDPRITESSGLVDLGSRWVTTNDSGDSAQLFVVDPATGRTIGVSHYHSAVVDVEALAPDGRSVVWVGDIGDNDHRRTSVSLYRVLVGPGRVDVAPRRYPLVYPHGRPNAESLFADRSGRLYVISKAVGGGIVYRAPARLSTTRPNRLVAVARVAEYATDAALAHNRRYVLVRGPQIAGVYTVPGFKRVGSFKLPIQVQGEGISVAPSGVVRVSSEGVHAAVRRVPLSAAVSNLIGAPRASAPSPSPSATPSTSPSASPSPSSSASPTPSSSASTSAVASPKRPTGARPRSGIASFDSPWLMWSIPAVIAVGALGIGLGLRRRTE